jgi:gliding motility-associated-like protein
MIASNGSCRDTVRTTIIAETPTSMIIPNVFSPNGDGINDEFFIINTGMTSLNCEIFNRWGQLLFTITAPHQSWDGKTPNGQKAPDGTYMYLLQATGVDGVTYKQQGTVTLVR